MAKLGYNLLNVLDLRAGGAMVEAIQAEGKPTWLDQIRYRFLHPSSESFAAYANTVLGEDNGDGFDDTIDPAREEVIVLSSEGSDRSLEGLTPHSARACPVQGAVNEPVDVDVDVRLRLLNSWKPGKRRTWISRWRRRRRLRRMLLKLLQTFRT
ncbi:hypothetical protein HanHA300_Chr10g0369641 [Helianthus annuus]|nr:hypothetical protein HanHA300_Chr10g0369641 [Helianthus annuus]